MGVPDITPVEGLIKRPEGRDPDTTDIVNVDVSVGVTEKYTSLPIVKLV